MDTTFALLPPAPAHNPVKQAVARANELGEKSIATTLGYFATMAGINRHHCQSGFAPLAS
jgi:hypothetical protein